MILYFTHMIFDPAIFGDPAHVLFLTLVHQPCLETGDIYSIYGMSLFVNMFWWNSQPDNNIWSITVLCVSLGIDIWHNVISNILPNDKTVLRKHGMSKHDQFKIKLLTDTRFWIMFGSSFFMFWTGLDFQVLMYPQQNRRSWHKCWLELFQLLRVSNNL